MSIALSDCQAENAQFSKLKEFSSALKENQKSVALVKFGNEEVNIFDQEDFKELRKFVSLYKKEILHSLTNKTMNSIFGLGQPAVLLFMNEDQREFESTFQEIAFTYIKEDNLMFVSHVQNDDTTHDYNARHLKYTLGVSDSELPALRILEFKS